MNENNQNNNPQSNMNQENNTPYNVDNMNNGFNKNSQNMQFNNPFLGGNSYQNVKNQNTESGNENTKSNTQNVMPGFENQNAGNTQSVMPGFENQNAENTQSVMPGFENQNAENTQNVISGIGSFEKKPENEPLPKMQNFSGDNIQNQGQSVYSDQGFDNSNVGDQQNYNNEQFNTFSDQAVMQDMNNGLNSQNANGVYGQSNYQNMNGMVGQQNYQNMNELNGQNYQDMNNPMTNGEINNGFNNGNNSQNTNMNYSFGQNNAQNSADYNLEFVKTWMGDIYEKAHSRKFNLAAALVGGMYLYFRKMYGLGTVILIITMILMAIGIFTQSVIMGVVEAICYAIMFFGLGFGFYPLYRRFVKGKLNKYKQETNDNNQLIDIARKKGGTSIGALIIYIVLSIVCTEMINVVASSQKNIPQANTTNNVQQNEVDEQVQLESYTIDNQYEIEYDASKWEYKKDTDSLVCGPYTLKYATKYPETSLKTNFSEDAQRASTLEMLVTSFTNQAASQNMQVESPNSTFIAKNLGYYAYVDVIGAQNCSRYYFVILPEDKLLFQFVLTVNDTTIDSDVNIDVIDMLTQIKKITKTNKTTNENLVNENSTLVSENSTIDENSISNETRTILSSNDTNEQAQSNTTSGRTMASNILGTND